MILAGDVGGTKTLVALFEPEGSRLEKVRGARYESPDFPGLGPIVESFLGTGDAGEREAVTAACFGIAGPVIGDRVRTPNLPWEIVGRELAARCGIPSVRLINDLEATAEGIPHLEPSDLVTLSEGEEAADGNRAVIAAGTGLGMCLAPRTAGGWRPVATEGGHTSFSPQCEEEVRLLEYLRAHYGHVSNERVVSGPGLGNLYDHLADLGAPPANAEVAAAVRAAEDPATVIGPAALARSCPRCVKALDLFVAAYGAAAGDLALLAVACGGLYVGGGIAPKILEKLTDGAFVRAFTAKGRFTAFLEKIPVRVITNPETALRGAASRGTFGDRHFFSTPDTRRDRPSGDTRLAP